MGIKKYTLEEVHLVLDLQTIVLMRIICFLNIYNHYLSLVGIPTHPASKVDIIVIKRFKND